MLGMCAVTKFALYSVTQLVIANLVTEIWFDFHGLWSLHFILLHGKLNYWRRNFNVSFENDLQLVMRTQSLSIFPD